MADSRVTTAALILFGILLAGWVWSQFGQLTGRGIEANIAGNYQGMAIISLVIFGLSAVSFAFFRFIGISGSQQVLLRNSAIGAAIGFIATATGKLILIKLLHPGAIDPTLSFTFVNVLAPIVETFFFVGALYPSFKQFFSTRQNALAAIVIAASLAAGTAAIWHFVASGGNDAALFSYFVTFLIFIGLAEATKSIEAPIMAHFVLNLITGG